MLFYDGNRFGQSLLQKLFYLRRWSLCFSGAQVPSMKRGPNIDFMGTRLNGLQLNACVTLGRTCSARTFWAS